VTRAWLAIDPLRPNTLYFRASRSFTATGEWGRPRKPPVGLDLVARSTNSGRSWTVLARSDGRGAPRLPFNAPAGYDWLAADERGLWSDGRRLLTLAAQEAPSGSVTQAGVWCSSDGGAHWTRLCAG
jgi:hypothetical protein